MTAVSFTNERLGPELASFHALADRMAYAFGYTADLPIDRQIAELVRLRVAQLTPCSYCLILHTRVAVECGIDAAKVAHLPSWRESRMFSEAECAALAYCEALTNYDLASFARAHREMTKHYDVQEIAAFAAVVINMNVWTRLKLAEGAVPALHPENSDDAVSTAAKVDHFQNQEHT
jgi:AhpD family alkylhydroperoxidase